MSYLELYLERNLIIFFFKFLRRMLKEMRKRMKKQLDDHMARIPFLEALYYKTMLNPMNFEIDNNIYARELNEIISKIHMLFLDVENIFLKSQIEESYASQQYDDKKEFH